MNKFTCWVWEIGSEKEEADIECELPFLPFIGLELRHLREDEKIKVWSVETITWDLADESFDLDCRPLV